MSSAIHIAELKERLVLKHFFHHINCPDYNLSPLGSFAAWDFKFIYKDILYLGDIKCMNCENNTYDRVLLENKKLEGLLLESFKMNVTPNILYVCHYSDGYTRTVNITPELIKSLKAEKVNIGGINKVCYFIPLHHTKLIKFYVPEQTEKLTQLVKLIQ